MNESNIALYETDEVKINVDVILKSNMTYSKACQKVLIIIKIPKKLKVFTKTFTKRKIRYTVEIAKDCYDNNEFEIIDVDGISRGITKHDELFDYVDT